MPVTVLIVGDHCAVRRALRGWLEITFPGCRVIEAASGTQAVAMAEASAPDVVLVDAAPSGMNGYEITAQLKDIAPCVPVVVLTSYEAEAHCTHMMASGASACVPHSKIHRLHAALAGLLFP